MSQLASHPRIQTLTKELGLPSGGDCLERVRHFAIARIADIVGGSPVLVGNLDLLRQLVADKLRLRVEFIRTDEDVQRIAQEQGDFHPHLPWRLRHEFLESDTEGITLERDEYDPIRYRYLAVADARGERSARAYFTAWHEITHLVIYPEQLAFPGFRRSPTEEEKRKDPLEQVVDHVTGWLAFYDPLFRPVLADAMEVEGGFTFAAFDRARLGADPNPSLLSTAISSLRYAPHPTLLVTVDLARKKAEERALRAGQGSFDFAEAMTTLDARAVTVVPSPSVPETEFEIRRNMRVPRESVLWKALEGAADADLVAEEDQSWWETSSKGHLAPLPIRVQATRQGRFVYGLIEATPA